MGLWRTDTDKLRTGKRLARGQGRAQSPAPKPNRSHHLNDPSVEGQSAPNRLEQSDRHCAAQRGQGSQPVWSAIERSFFRFVHSRPLVGARGLDIM